MYKIIIFTTFLSLCTSWATENNDRLNNPEINTDGCDPSPASGACNTDLENTPIGDFDAPSTGLRPRRKKLEDRNKISVEKKIEDIRVKQEIVLTNKLQDALNKKHGASKEGMAKATFESQKEKPSDKLLKEVQAELTVGSSLDEKIDPIKLDDNKLKSNVTLLKVPNANGELPSKTIESSNLILKDKYCNQAALQKIKAMGISLVYSYKATNGELLYEVSVHPDDCQKNSKNVTGIDFKSSEISDGCNTSPYSNACTVGPKNYGINYGDNNAKKIQINPISPAPIAIPPVEKDKPAESR